ncbi:c-type cytochrome [Cupriavidus plantarum]|nr:cytochrome c family protein [Cupriavidus plantarum]NYH99323.1 cytochrome c [Cupriavidus plantarum]
MRRSLMPCLAASLLTAAVLPLPSHAAGEPAAGERVFTSKCASCHRVGPNARGGFGPQLNGIVGRQAGSASDYRYSDAMKSAGFAWSEERLRAFIKSPGKVVPGNKMLFWGMRDDKDIDDLLAYLRTFP